MNVTTGANHAIITPLVSDLDGLASAKLLATLLPLGKRFQKITINLEGVERVTSAGLRALLDARQTIENDRQMVISTSNPSIRSLLRMTGLDRLIDTTPTLHTHGR